MLNRISRAIRTPAFWLALGGWGTISAVLLIGAGGCGHNATAQGDAPQQEQTLTVATTTPRVDTIRRAIVQPGWISSYEHTPMYAKLAGFLQDVRVDIGDRLKKGDLLCKIWVPEIEEDVQVKKSRIVQAEADVRQAKATLEVAKSNVATWRAKVLVSERAYERAQSEHLRWQSEVESDRDLVYNKKTLDKQTLAEAENQLQAAKATEGEAKAILESVKASLNESIANQSKAAARVEVNDAKFQVCTNDYNEEVAWFNYAEIKAPYDGVVTHRYIHTGHFVQPVNSGTTSKAAEPLFMFMRTDRMRIVIQVPEYDAPLVKDGADAIVRIQSLKDKEIVGKVTRSSWSLNNESRTLRVEIFLENPKGELQAGMYVNVSIMADLANVTTLPVDAVLIDADKNYIYVVEDGKAKRLNIKVGVQNDRLIQVISKEIPPLSEGDEPQWVKLTGNERVIVSHLTSLSPGQPVNAK